MKTGNHNDPATIDREQQHVRELPEKSPAYALMHHRELQRVGLHPLDEPVQSPSKAPSKPRHLALIPILSVQQLRPGRLRENDAEHLRAAPFEFRFQFSP